MYFMFVGRVNFRKDLWDCYCGQRKKLAKADWRVLSNDPISLCDN